MLGLYFRVGLPVVVLLGKGRVLGYSRSKPSCLVFGVHGDGNMKHNGEDKSCKRKAAPNVTRPCDSHSHRSGGDLSTESVLQQLGISQGHLVRSGGFQEEAQLMCCLLVLFSVVAIL